MAFPFVLLKEVRAQAGIIASAKFGKDIRNAISSSLTDIASVLEEEEIPVRKMAVKMYFRRIITGLSLMNLLVMILLVVNML